MKETLRPCDCESIAETKLLEEQGVGHNDESITVIPNYVLFKMGHTEVKISMKRFRLFAEWFMAPQELKESNSYKVKRNENTSI